jgi:hypothetical protein
MRHISTKILVLTLLLVSTLILLNGGISLQVLSTESRAYTLQGQQSQTQAILKRTSPKHVRLQPRCLTSRFARRI